MHKFMKIQLLVDMSLPMRESRYNPVRISLSYAVQDNNALLYVIIYTHTDAFCSESPVSANGRMLHENTM